MYNNPPYKPGTTLPLIIADGWSRGFEHQQTIEEAKMMGFDITLDYLKSEWAKWDAKFERDHIV